MKRPRQGQSVDDRERFFGQIVRLIGLIGPIIADRRVRKKLRHLVEVF